MSVRDDSQDNIERRRRSRPRTAVAKPGYTVALVKISGSGGLR
jgi:hypothetical protein